MSRGPYPILLALAMSLPGAVRALGLGDIRVDSALNEPLSAQIDIVGATRDELIALTAKVANQEIFQHYGADRPAFLTSARFKVGMDSQGRPVLNVRSAEPFTDPVVNFLVDLHWGNGELIREYSLLLDPSGFSPSRFAGAPAPTGDHASPASAAARLPLDTPASAAVRTPPNTAASDVARAQLDTAASAASAAVGMPLDTAASSAARTPLDTAASAAVRTPLNAIDPRVAAMTQEPPPRAKPSANPALAAAPGTGASQYRVAARDTLRGIVRHAGARSESDARPMMIAIFRANPHAFAGNINRLLLGAVLRMPSAEDVAAIGDADARREVRAHMTAWRMEGRPAAPRAALPAPPALTLSGALHAPPSVASQSFAAPSVASQSFAAPSVASQSLAAPSVAAPSIAAPSVASPSVAPPSIASRSGAVAHAVPSEVPANAGAAAPETGGNSADAAATDALRGRVRSLQEALDELNRRLASENTAIHDLQQLTASAGSASAGSAPDAAAAPNQTAAPAAAAAMPFRASTAGAVPVPVPVPAPATAAGADATHALASTAGAVPVPAPATAAGADATHAPASTAGSVPVPAPATAAGADATHAPASTAGSVPVPAPATAAGADATHAPASTAGSVPVPAPATAAGADATHALASTAGSVPVPAPATAAGADATHAPATAAAPTHAPVAAAPAVATDEAAATPVRVHVMQADNHPAPVLASVAPSSSQHSFGTGVLGPIAIVLTVLLAGFAYGRRRLGTVAKAAPASGMVAAIPGDTMSTVDSRSTENQEPERSTAPTSPPVGQSQAAASAALSATGAVEPPRKIPADQTTQELAIDAEALEQSYLDALMIDTLGIDALDNGGGIDAAAHGSARPGLDDAAGLDTVALDASDLGTAFENLHLNTAVMDFSRLEANGIDKASLDDNLVELDATVEHTQAQHVQMPSRLHDHAVVSERRVSIIDALKSAIDRDPNRRDLRMKLLETYYNAASINRRAFLESVKAISRERESLTADDWQQIFKMGQEIAADDILFAAPSKDDLADCA